MRLCLALGKSQGELFDSMSSRDISEWIAYDNLYLLPDPYRAAAGTSQVVAASMGGRRLPVAEFMPTRPPVKRDVEPTESGAAKFEAFARAHNAKIERARG